MTNSGNTRMYHEGTSLWKPGCCPVALALIEALERLSPLSARAGSLLVGNL